MAILLKCKRCEYKGTVPDEQDGEVVSCPFCEKPCEVEGTRERIRAVASPAGTKKCPFCGEEIQSIARKCKHCNEFLDAELLYLMELSDKFDMEAKRRRMEVRQTKGKLRSAEILGGISVFLSIIPAFKSLRIGGNTMGAHSILSMLFVLIYSGSTAGVFLLAIGAKREFKEETDETIDIRPPVILGLIALGLGVFFLLYLKIAGQPFFHF